MKHVWTIAGFVMLALAPIARGDEAVSASQAKNSALASALDNLKAAWPKTDAPTCVIKVKGVPNFGKLNAAVWRSGQPTQEGYQTLAEQGLKTVINFRKEFPQDKDRIPDGVRYIYMPMINDRAPTDEQARNFMDVIKNAANWPVLIHCTAGEGRTGTMAALIRHSLDGWQHASIMEEIGIFWKDGGPTKMRMAACQQQYIKDWELIPGLFGQAPIEKAN